MGAHVKPASVERYAYPFHSTATNRTPSPLEATEAHCRTLSRWVHVKPESVEVKIYP